MKQQKSNSYAFIFETPSVFSNHSIEILEEQKIDKNTHKVVASVYLQEANSQNLNKRIYSGPICESIVNQLSPKANSRSLLMEIDQIGHFLQQCRSNNSSNSVNIL